MNPMRGFWGRSLWQSANAAHTTKARRRFNLAAPRPMAAQVDVLEQRLVLSPGSLVIGSDRGASVIGVFDKESGFPLYQFNPYADVPGYNGGVRTAMGFILDFNGNSTHEVIIAAPGPGLFIPDPNAPGPVRVFSARGGTLLGGTTVNAGQLLTSLNPYPTFGGGIFVAAADFDRDGYAEVVTGADEGGGPHVRVVTLSPFTPFRILFDAFVYDPSFAGGVRVATGNVNFPNDLTPDLIVGAGPGGGPHVRVFNGVNGVQFAGAAGSFFAYNPGFAGGVFVASGNFGPDAFNETRAEVVVGAGAGGGPHVRIIDIFGPDPNNPAFDFTSRFVFELSFTGGVRVAAAYVNGDIIADLIVGRGPGFPADGNDIRVFFGATTTVLYQGVAFNPRFFGGIFPSSSKFIAFAGSSEPLQIDPSAEPTGDGVTRITTDDVGTLFDAAIDRFEAAGVSESLLNELGGLQIYVANLEDGFLALAGEDAIIVDDDAAGFGWFVDPTPFDDEEFGPDGFAIDQAASGKVDLFTTLMHELGHHLGLGDLNSDAQSGQLMQGTLNVGERRLPERSAFDVLFSGDNLLDQLMAPSLF